MTVNPKDSETSQGDNANDAEIQGDKTTDAEITVWDTQSDISKNPKRISWFVIFASALANFSDGYQNNLVNIAVFARGIRD